MSKRTSELTALTGASIATGDLLAVVDVSDTTSAVTGTDKKTTIADIVTAITSLGALATDAEVTSAIAALSTVYQPLDSDLTAIAALTTTPTGRSILAAADAAALRTILGLGTAATTASTAYDAAGLAAAAQAASQPLDSDLTAIAALTTTPYGRALLGVSNLAALQAILGTTGTPSSTTYLRGDGTWNTPSGGGAYTGSGGVNITSTVVKLETGAAPNALTGSPTCVGWWDANTITPVADGTALASWAGTVGPTLSQATGSKQPLYRTAAAMPLLNGLPGVQFDGTDDLLANASTGIGSLASWTIMAVAQSGGAGNQAILMDGGGSASAGILFQSNSNARAGGGTQAVSPVAFLAGNNAPNIYTAVYTGSVLTFYIGGNIVAFATPTGSNDFTGLYMSTYNGSAFPFNGRMGDVAMWSTALSATQRREAWRFFANKYTLPIVIPA